MTDKSISGELSEILSRLSVDQRRFVVARMEHPTKGDAAKAIGLRPNTIYRWPEDVERAIELLSQDVIEGAKVVRLQALLKAVMVKVEGLNSKDEKIRQEAATEIIEWELGKAPQRQEVTGAGGGAIKTETVQTMIYLPENGRDSVDQTAE